MYTVFIIAVHMHIYIFIIAIYMNLHVLIIAKHMHIYIFITAIRTDNNSTYMCTTCKNPSVVDNTIAFRKE